MEITLNISTDSEKMFELFGLDKTKVIEYIIDARRDIFEKVVNKAITYGHANNMFMYPMKDYLAYSEESKEWAEEFDRELNKVLMNSPFYIAGDAEENWRGIVYFSGRHWDIGLRRPEEAIKLMLEHSKD